MTVNAVDFGKLLEGKFNVAAFQESMSASPSASLSPAPSQGEQIQVGQMKTEPEQSQEVGQNGGMASIVQNLSEQAAAKTEQAALALSGEGAAQAEGAAIDADSKYTPANSQTKGFDNRINNLIFGAVDKALGQQGADCSLDDVACQNVGAKQPNAALQR